MDNSLKSVLERHHRRIKRKISRHKKAASFIAQKQLTAGNLREKSAKLLTAGALAGALLLSPGTSTDLPKLAKGIVQNVFAKSLSGESLRNAFTAALAGILPKEVGPLSQETEDTFSSLFKRFLKINVKASLEGNHLNTTYGYTGEEQHLARFPGDTIADHDELQNIGMAPGLGAWGYFVPSKEELTPHIIDMEKYYIAAQTLYLPNWATRQPYLKDWYKFRKVLVVNPKNGQAAVAVIGDAGPASWTGKQFGCSPELMHHLGLDIGMKKGEIIVFFVDDKENKVKLGPINYDSIGV